MGCLKPMIKPFDSGWDYILNISSKLISLLVNWSCYCSNITKKKVTHLGSLIVQAFNQHSILSLNGYQNPKSNDPLNTEKASNGAG